MTYYRLAKRDRQTTRWIWQTTPVTSLQAVFQLLRIYRVLPQGGTRVFTASSREDLREMLRRQNSNLPSGSVTATQFLQERNIPVRERAQSASDQSVSAQAAQQGASAAAWAKDVWEKHVAMRTAQAGQPAPANAASSPLHESTVTKGASKSQSMSVLDKKRLELELGPGGDCDVPYSFALPVSMEQVVDWMRLLDRVKRGKLVP